ncbi:FAD-dependent monooxygenase [Actinopolymorpha sp. B11F2]|uniref:FAD-dependent monooxygenase n=1 Tax=Actinopolymorpha sp. B11F2 TaxID=3160862 RepID=UPI0032E39E85
MGSDRPETDQPDVLVVGAGPTGMVAALVLAANGVSCRVVERRTEPNESSRALGLQARSMELLAGLGLADRIARVAYTLTGASIMRGDDELVRMPWMPPESPYPYTYVLPQQGLEAILRQRLDQLQIPVDAGCELDELTQDDRSVTARLTDGRRLRARWLIGADGSQSRVREQLGIPFTGVATGETYYLGDTVLDPAPPIQDSAMWLGPEGPLMLMRLPGPDHLWRIFVDVTDRARHGSVPEPTPDILERILQSRGPTQISISRADWTSIFRTRVCLADEYRKGRVFLAGDAAHVFPPFGGQGMNLGIQDAFNLAWRLARVDRGAPSDLLDDYQTERRPAAEATIRDVEIRRRIFALRNPLARAGRDLLLSATSRSQGGARRSSRQNSQLDVSYSRRRLPRPATAAPVTGDRAPDTPVGAGTIHDHIGPDHLTLIIFDPAGAHSGSNLQSHTNMPGTDPVIVRVDDGSDPDGTARAAYGMRRGGFVLVRPDGHIADLGPKPVAARDALTRFAADPKG